MEDEALVFDVETLPYQGGVFPVLAVAVGREGWYGWCSPWLTGDDSGPEHLIPFGPKLDVHDGANEIAGTSLFEKEGDRPRLLIGHNVLFDRARVATEYAMRRPVTRWMDTLSLHVAVSGLTNPQRPAWMKYKKERDVEAAAKAAAETEAASGVAAAAVPELDPEAVSVSGKKKLSSTTLKAQKSWKEVSSMNSLKEVAWLHCKKDIDKGLRDTFIDPDVTIADVRSNFEQLMHYCAQDVEVTAEVYAVVLPKFLRTCPHPASFAGALLMSTPMLPVDRHWPQYLERADRTYRERLDAVTKALKQLAEDARRLWRETGEDGRFLYEDDIWLRQLDWSPKKARRLPGQVPSKLRKRAVVAAEHLDAEPAVSTPKTKTAAAAAQPAWLASSSGLGSVEEPTSPLSAILLQVTHRGWPVVYTHSHGWLFAVPNRRKFTPEVKEECVLAEALGPKDELAAALPGVDLYTVPPARSGFTRTVLSKKRVADGTILSPFEELKEWAGAGAGAKGAEAQAALVGRVAELAKAAATKRTVKSRGRNVFLNQLDWTPTVADDSVAESSRTSEPVAATTHLEVDHSGVAQEELLWPQWYKDIDKVGSGLQVTIKKRAAALLLKLSWKGFPVVYSKEHGWIYRVETGQLEALLASDKALKTLAFVLVEDVNLADDEGAEYIKLPHPDGEDKNVGSPLSKSFVGAFEDGTLSSVYPVARDALALNASCSYWESAQDRITNQMVIWEGDAKATAPTPARIEADASLAGRQGMILPQVVPMGTVTRRAVERTWLTASNAKKNRVGSELKSMVRAPAGYAIVGADVDSEELWICSVMGDAQFGVHGATAIGWMTLEGTKSAGTDLHSKSASILGISRDDAKVFNYSRIYGAGAKHALQLLLKSNPALSTTEAEKLVAALYAGTKGVVDRGPTFGGPFWHGGTESFVFNKLEQIANSDAPKTPALGCGVTDALTKKYLLGEGRRKAGQEFIPSRINWVVQSSGVDYLHLLLVSMEYLTKRFAIDARYMISVHDEIRYLVREEDKYRLAMALQVANLWTRTLFAYRLGMGDLPQSCAFFSAVDVDSCFRKEVNMTCVTPSNPDAIPFGESLDVTQSLETTGGGSLFQDGRGMEHEAELADLPALPSALSREEVVGPGHRVDGTHFLVAQTEKDTNKIRALWNDARASKAGQARARTSSGNYASTADIEHDTPRRLQQYHSTRIPQAYAPRPKTAAGGWPLVGVGVPATSKPQMPKPKPRALPRKKLGAKAAEAVAEADGGEGEQPQRDADEEAELWWDEVPEDMEKEFTGSKLDTRRAEA